MLPVNAPFSCPNSSFSRMSFGSAAQLSAKGSLRAIALCYGSLAQPGFLPVPALAEDEDRRRGWRHRVDDLVDAAHLLGLPRELTIVRERLSSVVRARLACCFSSKLPAPSFDQRLELAELLGVERLLDEVQKAPPSADGVDGGNEPFPAPR